MVIVVIKNKRKLHDESETLHPTRATSNCHFDAPGSIIQHSTHRDFIAACKQQRRVDLLTVDGQIATTTNKNDENNKETNT